MKLSIVVILAMIAGGLAGYFGGIGGVVCVVIGEIAVGIIFIK